MTTSDKNMKTCHFAAEFIGTFFLVFIGCGAIALSGNDVISSNLIPMAFGLIVAVMIYSLGHISGAHFNPAVTISFAVLKRFSWRRVPAYLTAQLAGAIFASFLVKFFWHETSLLSVTTAVSIPEGIISELLFSFFLMFVITSVATDSRAVGELAGLAIGFTVLLCALVGGPISGSSMNPARSFGPALVNGNLTLLWIYLLFPIIGAIAGALCYNLIKCDLKTDSKHTCC